VIVFTIQALMRRNRIASGKKISSRKAKAVTSPRDLLAAIVESSEDAIFSRDLSGTVMTWNGAAERIFGYKAYEIIGRTSDILLPADRRGETRKIIESVRRGESIKHFETMRLHKDGQLMAVSLTASPIRDRSGRTVGVSTIARDISVERELQSRFLEAGERERRRIGRDLHDSLGQHISGMELLCRTLNRSLLRRGLPEARTAELLVRHLKSALGEVRALSRGMAPLVETPDGLMLALEDLAANVRSMFHVNCRFECDEPVLIADHSAANHMFRIVQEAVTNAIRHGKARRVTIRLRRRVAGLSLEIQDHGRGLAQPEPQTVGMGLRVMRYRASRMGGSLRVVNTLPRGVLVSCVVPQARVLASPDIHSEHQERLLDKPKMDLPARPAVLQRLFARSNRNKVSRSRHQSR
jgi:two-component system, LuxR family, sensor kinase FixL